MVDLITLMIVISGSLITAIGFLFGFYTKSLSAKYSRFLKKLGEYSDEHASKTQKKIIAIAKRGAPLNEIEDEITLRTNVRSFVKYAKDYRERNKHFFITAFLFLVGPLILLLYIGLTTISSILSDKVFSNLLLLAGLGTIVGAIMLIVLFSRIFQQNEATDKVLEGEITFIELVNEHTSKENSAENFPVLRF